MISNQFDPVNHALITINNTLEVGRTDLEVFFQISIPDSVKKILLKGVGVETTIIEFVDKCDEVEIIVNLSSSDDFITLKKSIRLLKKRLKKLPQLHIEANENGIFKTNKICYRQKLLLYHKKEQK